MRSETVLTCLLLASLSFASLGCSGKRIRGEYEAQRSAIPVTTRDKRPPGEANRPPYHLAFRIDRRVLDQVLSATLSRNLIDNDKLEVIRQESNEQLERLRQRGPMARRFAARVRELRDNGVIELKPTLTADSVRTRFANECDGCLELELQLTGTLEGRGLRPLTLQGHVVAASELSVVQLEDGPAIQARLTRIDQLDISFPIQLPGPFSQVQTRLEDALRGQLSDRIADQQNEARVTVSLSKPSAMPSGIVIDGVGIHTLALEREELFIGLNTTLAASPSIDPTRRIDVDDNWDWALQIGDDAAEKMAIAMMSTDARGNRFTRKGKPDPEGPVAVDIKKVRFTSIGFEVEARFWYLSFPAWWRDYTLQGRLEVRDGKLLPRLEEMVPGQGDGATWMAGIVQRQATSDRVMEKLSQTVPTHFSLRRAKGYELRIWPEQVVTKDGELAILGTLDIVEDTLEEE